MRLGAIKIRRAVAAIALVALGAGAGMLLTRSLPADASLSLPGTETAVPSVQASVPEVKTALSPLPSAPTVPTVQAPSTPTPTVSAPVPLPIEEPAAAHGETTTAPKGAERASTHSSSPAVASASSLPRTHTGQAAPISGASSAAHAPAASGRASRSSTGTRAHRKPLAARTGEPNAPALLVRGRSKASTTHAASRKSSPLDAIGAHIPLPLPVPDWSKPIILALLLLALALGVRSRLAVFRARGLERERNLLQRDVGAMQDALVPAVPERIGGLSVSVAYKPAEGPAAGGDFYDVFVPSAGSVALMLGDVAGHGPAALSHAALTRYTLRAYLQAGLSPRAAIALAGETLADPAGEHFATVIVAVYESSSGRLACASAGHPPPILLGMRGYEPSSVFACPPIGWGIPTGRRQSTIPLEHGACVCLFSDGLIEARAQGEMIGSEGLAEILRELGPAPTAPALLERVSSRADAARDDMAACLLSPVLGSARDAPTEEEVEVDTAAIGSPRLALLLAECNLSAGDVARGLALADGIAAQHGTAIVRVRVDTSGSTIAVDAPAPRHPEPSSAHAASGEARPLLHVVPDREEHDSLDA